MKTFVKILSLFASLLLPTVVLTGCAGVTADIYASGMQNIPQGPLTYRFKRAPVQGADQGISRYEASLRDGLAKYGFIDHESDDAHYLISVAYATRPAEIEIAIGNCRGVDGKSSNGTNGQGKGGDIFVAHKIGTADGSCVKQQSSGLSWFHPPWLHKFTLRVFVLPDGQELYKVDVVKRDDDADPQHAIPYLIASALARFPYAGSNDWRVTFNDTTMNTVPAITSIKPVRR